MPVRAVFDTNIWIAGLIWRGGPYRCLMLARVGAVQLKGLRHALCLIRTEAEQPQRIRPQPQRGVDRLPVNVGHTRRQQIAPAQDDGAYRGQHRQRLRPGRQPHDQRRGGVAAGAVRGIIRRTGQQREDRQHRDHGDVLKEQHGEGRLPARVR